MKRVGENLKADVSKKAKKEEDDRSPFELVPREIKEKILKMIEKKIVYFSDFQKFWGLMFVNKEFYSIMSSEYVRRHCLKYPCGIFSNQLTVLDDMTTMDVCCPIIYTSRYHEPKEMFDKVKNYPSSFHEIKLKIGWKDVPRYFEDKPFRIDCIWNRFHKENLDEGVVNDFREVSLRIFGVFNPQLEKDPECCQSSKVPELATVPFFQLFGNSPNIIE